MFSKLVLLALVAPLVSALTLHLPEDMRTQEEITITWDSAPGDPELFTLELINEEFNDAFAIASNIDPNQGSITVTIPVVPVRGGYTLEAVNIGNINEVYSQTGEFAVGPLRNASSSSGSSTGTSSTGTGTSTRSTTSTGTSTSSSTSHSTSTQTTPPATSQTTTTGAPAQATNLSGASSLKLNAAVAALAGVAGAAVFAL